MRRQIRIYDTTLRDGTQGEGVSFSMEDKVRLATRLDALGIHYIEGGWPGSNPKDLRFFHRMQDVTLKTAKLAAFSMTRRAGGVTDSDANMQAILESGAPVATIVGKSWDFHVTHALETTLHENLAMIADSVGWLTPKMDEVIYDAEHFFDGFRANRDYALATLKAADAAGARWLVLCDTNGGTLPSELVEVLREVKRHVRAPLGIHVHNDAECAVANSLAAVQEGVDHSHAHAQAGARLPARGSPQGAARALTVHRRAGQSQAVGGATVRRRLGVRPQGRHARVGRAQAPGDVRAHRARGRGQPSARAGLGAGRQVEHSLQGAGVRDRPRSRDARLATDPRPAQGARGSGIPVRGRRGVLRAVDGAGAGTTPALLRSRRVSRHRRGAERRSGAGSRGDGAAAREGHAGAHGGRRQRP